MVDVVIGTKATRIRPSQDSTTIGVWPVTTPVMPSRKPATFLPHAAQATPYIQNLTRISYLDLVAYWALEYQLHAHVPTARELSMRGTDLYYEMMNEK